METMCALNNPRQWYVGLWIRRSGKYMIFEMSYPFLAFRSSIAIGLVEDLLSVALHPHLNEQIHRG